MNHPLAAAAVATTALLTLTGCFRVDLDVAVDAEDTVAGTLVAAVDSEAMKGLTEMFSEMEDAFPSDSEEGTAADDTLDQGLDELVSGSELSGDAVRSLEEQGATVSVEEYTEDGFLGETVSFEGLALENVPAAFGDDEDGSLRITRDGDTYEVVMDMDLAETGQAAGGGEDTVDLGEMGFGDMDPASLGMRDPEARVSITLPGEITEANGEIDGNTVTWVMTGEEKKELRATAVRTDGDDTAAGGTQAQAEADEEDSSSTGVVAAVAGGAVLLALVGGLVLVRSRRRGLPQA